MFSTGSTSRCTVRSQQKVSFALHLVKASALPRSSSCLGAVDGGPRNACEQDEPYCQCSGGLADLDLTLLARMRVWGRTLACEPVRPRR